MEELIAGSDRTYLRGVDQPPRPSAGHQPGRRPRPADLRDYASGDQDASVREASYSASFAGNPEFAPDSYRLSYSSMVTPGTVYDYHPADQRLETRKVQEIPSGYDPSLYVTERLTITARDGAKVPVSVLRRKDFAKDGSGKLFVYGYGAYGYAVPPSFSTAASAWSTAASPSPSPISAAATTLATNGSSTASSRSGPTLQRLRRRHPRPDRRGLCRERPRRGAGGSAGGELMGAVVNQAGELYGAVVADVPFVDVLNTMLDDTLPLTPGEWTEWGNPITDADAFQLIRSYSPYDNVAARIIRRC